MNLRFQLFIAFITAFSGRLTAQRDTLLQNNQIEVIKNFIPILSDAIKIQTHPNPEKPVMERPLFIYSVPAQQFIVTPTIYTIKPLSMGTMLLPKLRGNYTRLGFGNYGMPLAELYLNTVRNKEYQAGLFFKHLSASGDQEYNNFANTTAYGYAHRFLREGSVGVDLYVHRNQVNFYGRPNDGQTLPNAPQQVYHLADAKSFYQNYSTDSSNLSYRTELNYYRYDNSGGFNENDIQLKGRFLKMQAAIPFEVQTAIRINNTRFQIPALTEPLQYRRNYFELNPQVFLAGTDLYLKGGFNSTFANDSSGTDLYFFPKAEAGYFLIHKKLTLVAGFTGNLDPVTCRGITSENPFVNSLSLRNTVNRFEWYGSIKALLGTQTSMQLTASSSSVHNLLLFTKDSLAAHQIAVYDDKTGVTSLQVSLHHQWNEKFRFVISAKTFGYSLSKEAQAYSLPTTEFRLNSTYNLSDKFLIRLDMLYWGERFMREDAIRPDGSMVYYEKKVLSFTDLNLGIDYRYNKSLGAFLNFSNLVNQRYERFYGYQVYGLNILGGFTFTF